MKRLLALAGAVAAIGLAAPAHAEPDGPGQDDTAFLAALDHAGFTYSSPGQVIASAKAACGLMSKGETGLQVVHDIKDQNPGMTMDGAARFAAIVANNYCPEHLTPKGH
ncbi:hypothetical protein A5672_09945 [Mycobacterium alsense]|uniref:DUF732 domain-containing protein n=1 Tax=Mycobacterium alsense TaxID=324058 RepID=A0ABD6P763_9MYCO|nr:DUF732 domain-containing protein [Mycobacterium alsense]OBG44307.1 hypothetical protein A5672_09945 [Mycobacterium alsense]OBJ01967.1 hypothetical protein A5660_22395 [Mycobacterium alsense]